MTNKLTNLSLAAILGFGACAGSREAYKPFYPNYRDELKLEATTPKNPPKPSKPGYLLLNKAFSNQSNVSSQTSSATNYDLFPESNRDLGDRSASQANFDSYVTGLPVQLVDDSTSVDFGLARVAASGDSVFVRPLYSSPHRFTLDNELASQRNLPYSDSMPPPVYFDNQDSFGRLDDDPEKVRREEGIVISSLLKWAWGWDVFSPLRNTANDVSDCSKQFVRDTLGSNSDFDYTGRRIILGYNIPIDRFYLELDLWADVADIDRSGIAIHMTLPFGTRR